MPLTIDLGNDLKYDLEWFWNLLNQIWHTQISPNPYSDQHFSLTKIWDKEISQFKDCLGQYFLDLWPWKWPWMSLKPTLSNLAHSNSPKRYLDQLFILSRSWDIDIFHVKGRLYKWPWCLALNITLNDVKPTFSNLDH